MPLPKFVQGLLLALVLLMLFPASALAATTINSVTLNGASTVTVAPSATITAAINVTTSSGSNWQSSTWDISGANCVDHTNYTSNGTFNESISVTAPSSPGTYSISFVAWGNNACGGGASNTYTMTNAITVSAPTPTPTPTPTSFPSPGATASPAPTSTSGETSAPSATSGPIYYPSLTLARDGLEFKGTSSIENGVIETAEYSLDNGGSWNGATPSDGKFDEEEEDFTFTPNISFITGNFTVLARAKSLAQVYTQAQNYASVSFSVTPPAVTLNDFAQNPTGNTTPTITGTASSAFSSVASVDVSLDGGKSWLDAAYSRGQFSFTPQALEDGNYEIAARAFDESGNVGISKTLTLVIDTFAPVIGGGTLTLGPSVLIPENNIITAISGADITVAVGMKGGVTSAKIIAGNTEFELKQQAGTDIWSGKIGFNDEGEKQLTITATDGANNTTERAFGTLFIQKPGQITDKEKGSSVAGAEVKLFFFDTISSSWVLWDAGSYGQKNPQKISETGTYSFMAPPGKYYIEAEAEGYRKTQSQIFTLTKTTAINADLALRSKPTLILTLPIIGKIILTIPELFAPPESVNVEFESDVQAQTDSLLGQPVPDLSLPDPSGVNISLANLRGKNLLLTFFSPLFPQALEQAAILSDASDELPENSNILAVSLQQSEASTRVLMQRGAYQFPVVYDSIGTSASGFNVNYLPKSFFINTAGKIIDVKLGVMTKDEIVDSLNNMQ